MVTARTLVGAPYPPYHSPQRLWAMGQGASAPYPLAHSLQTLSHERLREREFFIDR